jgi:hypothetical protein
LSYSLKINGFMLNFKFTSKNTPQKYNNDF